MHSKVMIVNLDWISNSNIHPLCGLVRLGLDATCSRLSLVFSNQRIQIVNFDFPLVSSLSLSLSLFFLWLYFLLDFIKITILDCIFYRIFPYGVLG